MAPVITYGTIYGVNLFGTSYYGPPLPPPPPPIYHIQPFIAASIDYATVLVSWKTPDGNAWDKLRLVKSWDGYPAHETDGIILVENDGATNSYADTTLHPGAYAYYSLFVHTTSSGVWSRAGEANCITISDQGSFSWVFDSIPNYFKYLGASISPVVATTPNLQINKFLSVFGWGIDYERTQAQAWKNLYDSRKNSYTQLALLGDELGIDFEPLANATRMRRYVEGASTLLRQRGTILGLQQSVLTLTGLGLQVIRSGNRMLSGDTAGAANPVWTPWNPALIYELNEQVSYQGFYYTCALAGTFGSSQPPSGTATSNTWWTIVTPTAAPTFLDVNGAIFGWQVSSNTTLPTGDLTLVQADPDPITSAPAATTAANNAFRIRNTAASTLDLTAFSFGPLLGESSMDPSQAVYWGVPIPMGMAWSATQTYQVGAIVTYGQGTYQALTTSLNAPPPLPFAADPNAQWLYVGLTGKPIVCFSAYCHQAFGTSSVSVPVSLVAQFYDQYGKILGAPVTSTITPGRLYDSFTKPSTTFAGRSPDIGSATWTVPVGQWTTDSYNGGTCRPPNPAVRSLALITGVANGQVAVTFVTSPSTGMKQELIFRQSDTSNYWRITRTTLDKMVAGTPTTVITFTTSFADGDRAQAAFQGSSIVVQKNQVTIATVTDSFNSTATGCGMATEAT